MTSLKVSWVFLECIQSINQGIRMFQCIFRCLSHLCAIALFVYVDEKFWHMHFDTSFWHQRAQQNLLSPIFWGERSGQIKHYASLSQFLMDCHVLASFLQTWSLHFLFFIGYFSILGMLSSNFDWHWVLFPIHKCIDFALKRYCSINFMKWR